MRDAGSRVLLEIFRNLQLLPDPHPALRATFPGEEGFGVCGFAADFRKNSCIPFSPARVTTKRKSKRMWSANSVTTSAEPATKFVPPTIM